MRMKGEIIVVDHIVTVDDILKTIDQDQDKVEKM
jgi:hypothetical protein